MDIVHPQRSTSAPRGNALTRLLSGLGVAWDWARRGRPVTVENVQPAFAAMFRTLALEISARATTRPLRSILVMSAYPKDGRTLTVAHLGMALARLGHRVTLVEADSGRAELAQLFRVMPGQAVSGGGPAQPSSPITPTPIAGLHVALPVVLGQAPSDAALVTDALNLHCSSSDFVILDSPPCRDAGDSFFLAPLVDGVVFVVRRRQQEIATLRDIRARLERLGVNVIGAIYNDKG